MPRIGTVGPRRIEGVGTVWQSRVIADGMLVEGTPIEDYRTEYGLWVKREDLACLPPGPQFSKTRGVYAHVKSRREGLIGVLDTSHSQAGHAVARACQILGKQCLNFYPNFVGNPGPKEPQLRAQWLGASLYPLQAGRSAILFHQAKKITQAAGGYMMPNALKLQESVDETAKEVPDPAFLGRYEYVLIPASSGTIAAGVVKGFHERDFWPWFIIHLGYSRSKDEVERYIKDKSGCRNPKLIIIDEGYEYKDKAKDTNVPPWPCNEYYDLKAFQWHQANRSQYPGETLMWNIG